ncbi:hypothetical protein SDC9_125334 [bioreactor metagenome]|uniref:Phosphoglycolate phosphatase n=1 Tax=bioreactor metagenome TaxID=1076179 RepID=A0A645CMZ8_9ZZZZ
MLLIAPFEIPGSVELTAPFAPRRIECAFHDIDGTHSLIREWIPVMTLALGWVARHGLPPEDPEEACRRILADGGETEEFGEARRFAVESAGLSALTQMEWAIRSALENGAISGVAFDPAVNREVIARIWNGEELFPEHAEPEGVTRLLREKTPALFQVYERLLMTMNRNRNLEAAKKNPEKWRVPGSMEFLRELRRSGVRNYFVTGAVVEQDAGGNPSGTMYEEIRALGYETGPGKLLEGLEGSSWREKLPKHLIMRDLCAKLGVSPEHVLVVGDGRSEIAAGVEMGAVTMSRLPASARRAREIHIALGTHFLLEEYSPELRRRLCRTPDGFSGGYSAEMS